MAETRQPIMEIPLATMSVQGTVGSFLFQAAYGKGQIAVDFQIAIDCHHEI